MGPQDQIEGHFCTVRDVRMGVPNARKTDGSELRDTLEGMEHGKGAEVRSEVRKKGRYAERIS